MFCLNRKYRRTFPHHTQRARVHLRRVLQVEALEVRRLLATWSGDIPNGTVWSNTEVQRIVGNVRVPAGATLAIEPGTIVKVNEFAGFSINVEGTLLADGTPSQPIVFTSLRDDTGLDGILNTADDQDTNGNGPSNGNNGDWNRIEFKLGSTGNILDNIHVRFAGAESAGAVVVDGAGLALTNSVIRNSATSGVRLQTSDSTLTTNTFQNNSTAAISMDLASNPAISGVTVTNNGANALVLDAGTLVGNGFWNDPDIVYRLTGDVTVPAGSTLTVGAGQIVKFRTFAGDDLYVDGTLIADGTSSQPIIFTSDRDDSAGGDTNNNAASNGNNGDWSSIQLNATSTANLLNHADLRFGGGGRAASVVADGGSLTVTKSIVRNSSSHAIVAQINATANLSNNVIVRNSDTAIRAESGSIVTVVNNTLDGNFRGVAADGAATQLTLTNNLITNHTGSGVFRSNGAAIATRFNDVFNPNRLNYDGLTDQTGQNGNRAVDPKYFNATNSQFNLRAGSPAIDSATSIGAPATDFFGNPRYDDPNLLNQGAGTVPFFDRGAIERQDVSISDVDLAVIAVRRR